jgi:thymidylate synthase (FAD)
LLTNISGSSRALTDRNIALAMLALCRERLPSIFATAGARCERLGYCPESERFTCGRYPLRDNGA